MKVNYGLFMDGIMRIFIIPVSDYVKISKKGDVPKQIINGELDKFESEATRYSNQVWVPIKGCDESLISRIKNYLLSALN